MHPSYFPLFRGHICSPEHHRANLLPDSYEGPSNVWKQPLGVLGVYSFFPSGELSSSFKHSTISYNPIGLSIQFLSLTITFGISRLFIIHHLYLSQEYKANIK